jgi:hypothetical protein
MMEDRYQFYHARRQAAEQNEDGFSKEEFLTIVCWEEMNMLIQDFCPVMPQGLRKEVPICLE